MLSSDAKVVRREIDELLTSGRLQRRETISAHIYQMVGIEWKELTKTEILVHIFRDSLDGVDKILARNHFELIFDFAPLSASLTFTCLSKKFVRLTINKFDRSAATYGFGFSNSREMEKFCTQLDRIRSYARATLAPTLHVTALGLSKLGVHSPPTTPSRSNIAHDNTSISHYDYCNDRSSLSMAPFNNAPSPYRQPLITCDNYVQLPSHGETEEPLTSSTTLGRPDISHGNSVCRDVTFASETRLVPACGAPDSKKAQSGEACQIQQHEDNAAEDKLDAAERRLRALMDAIQPINVIDNIWNNSFDQIINERLSVSIAKTVTQSENPAGAIGSPVKGRGGKRLD